MKQPRRFRTVCLAALIAAGSASPGRADEAPRPLTWEAPVAGASVIGSAGQGQALEIVSEDSLGRTVTVLEIEEPGITQRRYAIHGLVAYDDVEGLGYLEMWSVFADGNRFFSRTLGQGGAQPLSGSADWRPFLIPFDLLDAAERPSALTVGVVLPGKGRVRLRDLALHQHANGDEQAVGSSNAWWGLRTAAFVGGFGGAGFGVLASLFAWTASRGRARSAVLAGVTAMIAVAAVCLVAGLVALVLRQPYSVYYPLFLLGGLGVLILPGRLRAMRQHYTDLELHRMRRHDLGVR